MGTCGFSMVNCRSCYWGRDIGDKEGLGQLNREIVNLLVSMRYDLSDFCYCIKKGYIESRLMKRECREFIGISGR